MSKHTHILEQISAEYKNDDNNIALLVTGSVARNEQSESSDLDLLLIEKEKRPFKEEVVDEIVVELKTNTVEGYLEKMQEDSMQIYQWLDAKVIFDKESVSEQIFSEAKNIFQNYTPNPKEVTGTKKWLDSARIKIVSAQGIGDDLLISWNIANMPWIVVKGLFLLNKVPVPPSTTAFKNVTRLENLPEDFDLLWEEMLTGDLEVRTTATLKLIDFLTKAL